jgi:hypothetical protein
LKKMKLNKYYYLLALPIIAGVILFSAFQSKGTAQQEGKQGNEAIIKFSHSFHKDLAECDVCHSNVKTSKSVKDRLLPNHENCKTCHDVEDSEGCKTCHYDDTFEPLIQHETNVNFDHSFHLDKQKLTCDYCHKGISDVNYAFQAAQPYPPMETCYSCHNDGAVASSNCEGCHISTADLKPISHRSSGFIRTHKFTSREMNANCVMCHNETNNSCETCHTATTQVSENNSRSGNYSPDNFSDGARMQKLTRVHELNYRFVHGVDARTKKMDCSSCHDIESFCGSCHQSKTGEYGMGGIIPTTHFRPNFVTFGGSSALNEHGTFARRDIEECASCHDTQGGDPVCLTCHLDPDGVRGTNPKTHQTGFMKNDHGDWHNDQSSVCYNCHTSQSPSSTAGQGFCGYCHGAK